METEELTLPTQKEIHDYLERLNVTRLVSDQLADDFRKIATKPNATREEVSEAFDHKQTAERQYMFLCDWLWEHTPHGFYFDHSQQRYVLRLKSSLY